MFGVYHKYCEYKTPIPPHSGWSGGTMVPPWYRPIPVEHSLSPIFDQVGLSKARKPTSEPAAKRRKRLKRDGNWAFFCEFCASSRPTHLPPEVYSQNIKAETPHPQWFHPP